MKNLLGLFILVIVSSSCNSQSATKQPNVDTHKVQENFMNWWKYHNENIMLSADFIGIDANDKTISKEEFLTQLQLGDYLPVKMQHETDSIYYKLIPIEPSSDTSIKATILESAFNEYQNFKKEGQPFPTISVKDLKGTVIDNNFFKGKVTVIKCWYIHCTACVKEFPQVNSLVEKYKNNLNVQFISFAEDTPEQLQNFLTKKPLSFLVVPNMKRYMNDILALNAFPTHFIIDKDGKIVKVLSNFESLEFALDNYLKE